MGELVRQLRHHGFSDLDVEISCRKIRRAMVIVEKERGMAPSPVEFISREALEDEFNRVKRTLELNRRGNPKLEIHGIRNEHSCLTPLSSLKPTHLQKMLVRKHHKGDYLLCRTITRSHRAREIAISLAVEDASGWTQSVSVYNFPGTQNASQEELDTIFPKNTVLIIREPFCKVDLASVAKKTIIEIHSPTDLVFIEPDNVLLVGIQWKSGHQEHSNLERTSLQWKKTGDGHFMKKQYFAAAVAYSNAIQPKGSPRNYLLARSLAYIHLGAFNSALQDCQLALKDPNISEADKHRAFIQSARATYRNGDYNQSKALYLECLSFEAKRKDAKIGFEACARRLKEQNKRDYDWRSLFKQVVGGDIAPDVAECIGSVEVGTTPEYGGGRGVVATQDISPGELLVVSKPFAAFCKQESGKTLFRIINVESGEMNSELQYGIIQVAVIKEIYQPASSALYKLYGGEQFSSVKACAESQAPNHTLQFKSDIYVERNRRVLMLNSFDHDRPIELANRQAPKRGNGEGATIEACYSFPSYFNHSCMPNADRVNFGDLIVIRATRMICKGERVTLSYCGAGGAYDTRKNSLSQWFEKCDCTLCTADRAIEPRERLRRAGLLNQMKDGAASIQSLIKLARQINGTYPDSYPFFRWEAFDGYTEVFNRLTKQDGQAPDPERNKLIIQVGINALEALGVKVVPQNASTAKLYTSPISTKFLPYYSMKAVELCLTIFAHYILMADVWQAYPWLGAAIWIENGKNGGGSEFFREKYASSLEKMGLTQWFDDWLSWTDFKCS